MHTMQEIPLSTICVRLKHSHPPSHFPSISSISTFDQKYPSFSALTWHNTLTFVHGLDRAVSSSTIH